MGNKPLTYRIADHLQAGPALEQAREALKMAQTKFESISALEDEIANAFNPFAVHSED